MYCYIFISYYFYITKILKIFYDFYLTYMPVKNELSSVCYRNNIDAIKDEAFSF